MVRAFTRLGFTSVGSLLCRAAMRALGLVNDHLEARPVRPPASGAWGPLFGARYSRDTVIPVQDCCIQIEVPINEAVPCH
ncbi:hypothetical protein D3C81_571120 [compost metagenome]|nr:hypothetical protein [Aeromonas media]QJT25900.1 hypothetical protein E4185_06665 [Aeromonas media]WOQ13434.1 hypothetical protein R2X36_00505 [Aeromonas media]